MNGIGDFVTSLKETHRLAAQIVIELKGDAPGHPFRGNQWSGSAGRSAISDEVPKESSNVDISEDVTGAYSGQVNVTLTAKDPSGKKVGYIDYSLFQGDVYIDMIEVSPEHRRKGIAMKLYEKMVSDNPGKRVKWGMTTPEGTALRKAIMNKRLGKKQ